ncbi:MAG: sodium:proton antiporter [Propionibacteriaceae bacterium]|jgi:Na+/H+ antiporter NhaD/arsenite permease-like protein|nr:sodium:proton antiporter [Propionibacteriaceae bacterium]
MISWWLAVPFALMLMAIAVMPLLPRLSHWWEQAGHQLLLSAVLALPVVIAMINLDHAGSIGHALLEYAQFVILLFGLFTVAGGLALSGDVAGTPRVNSLFMLVGAVLASIIGTTGAAMLLIRPMLASNGHRRHRAHLVVFAVFIMANCGGLLTPLGDPPLFLGLLRGVPFTWTLSLWPQWLFVNALLMISFYCLDKALITDDERRRDIIEPLRVKGKIQIVWFVLIIVAVALIPSVNVEGYGQVTADGASIATAWWLLVPWRELTILLAAGASWLTCDHQARFDINHFSFAPIMEVAALFIGIFMTMVPVLMMLDAATGGVALNAVSFHLMTGGLSAVLDNAPTYASFFEVAQAGAAVSTDATLVAGVPESLLVAISTGAVFWGAMTYIGNGPNFMLRSIASHQSIRMPSFIGYIGWSLRWLLPVLLAAMLLFLADGLWAWLAGAALTLLILLRAGLLLAGSTRIRLPRRPS